MPTTRSQISRGKPRPPPLQKAPGTAKKRKPLADQPESSKPAPKRQKTTESTRKISINRAPVLTLWAAAVAERQGYSYEEGLTFGRWISGVMAQSKGRSLGIYEAHEKTEAEKEAKRQRDAALGVQRIDAFGMHIPALKVDGKMFAASEGKVIHPNTVQSYLERSFGGHATLGTALEAMRQLAGSFPAEQIGKEAYRLYEQIRPEWKGWGGKGHLDLDLIQNLASSRG